MNQPREKWQKTLYANKGYPDNYTDPSFLKDLQKNKNVKTFTLWEAIVGVTKLNHQISCITAFLLIFYSMYTDAINPNLILLYSSLTTSIGYLFYVWNRFKFGLLVEDLKTVISVLVFGYIFSPMLHTLTNSISTDTIFTITFFVMFLHLVFFDYGMPAFMVSKAVSLNAAIFGSICLASRLSSSYHAFTLLVVAAESFALVPILMKTHWSPVWLLPVMIGCIWCLRQISASLLITYILGSLFISLFCPYVFVYQQKYKNNIHGPWDEAIVKDLDLEITTKCL